MTTPVLSTDSPHGSAGVALPTKVTGIVFWGMAVVGLFIMLLVMHGLRHRFVSGENARADRFAFSLQQYLVHQPSPSAAQLSAAALRLCRHTGVTGADIQIGSVSAQVGNTDPRLEMLPRMIRYITLSGTPRKATAVLTVYEPQVTAKLAATRRRILLSTGLIILAFGTVLRWVLGTILSQPFERMVADARAFSGGETETRFDETRDDEFGFLARFINRALDFSFSQQQALRNALENVKRSETALYAEKERAEVTLHSIGDAVITTDADTLVEYMNPTAESLTGLQLSDIIGRPLAAVLALVDEETRYPVESPVLRCLREGAAVDRMDHVIMLCPGGREIDVAPSAAPIHSRNGIKVGAIMVLHDVGQVRRTARQLSYQANHDPLTGLSNRREFERQMQIALDEVRRDGCSHALCFLDMDQFKVVNDTCGHAAGDELLRRFSTMLRTSTRDTDVIARLGGDEFGLLLKHCDLPLAKRITEDLLDNVRGLRFIWSEHSFDVGVSIGIVPVLPDHASISEIMSAADVACYAAKDAGRNRIHAYSPGDENLRQRHTEMRWVSRLQQAMEHDRFRLFCQPVVAVAKQGQSAEYFELLLRLLDEGGGLIPPTVFVPAAERYGLMPQIDRWVIHAALKALQSADSGQNRRFAINVSGQSLRDPDFLKFVSGEFTSSGIAPVHICFEVNEAAVIAGPGPAMETMAGLRSLGCALALDNFGSCLDSFVYLRKLKVDYIKLAGDVIKEMPQDPFLQSIIEATNRIAHAAGISTVGKFAENQNILSALRRSGTDYAQGHAIANPMPLEDILADPRGLGCQPCNQEIV